MTRGLMIWDEMICANTLNQLRNDGIYTPPTVEGSLFYPGNGGGNNWGSPAINPDSQTMYVITGRTVNHLKLTPREECEKQGRPNQKGTPYCSETSLLMSPLGALRGATLGYLGCGGFGGRKFYGACHLVPVEI